MLIGIVGNYGNDNQGDEAILEGILVQLEKAYPIKRKDILVFSNNPEQTREKFGVQTEKLYVKKNSAPGSLFATIKHNMPAIRKLDFLIIGGGGILMDLYVNGLVIFGMYGWLAKLSNKPVIIYGVGAGPVSTSKGKIILKSLGNLARLVTVRDEESKQLLTSIGVKQPIQVIADPAFQVPAPEKKEQKNSAVKVGVTAVPYFHTNYWPKENREKYQNFIRGMAINLDCLLAENPDVTVTFFATKYPQDAEVTKEIQGLMKYKDQIHIHDSHLNHQEMVQLINEQDLIIGTRLHSLILALVANTPVIGVSYHPKVNDFMKMIQCEENSIQIEELHRQERFFIQIYEEMNQDWEKTVKQFEAISQQMKYREPQGMELIKKAIAYPSGQKSVQH